MDIRLNMQGRADLGSAHSRRLRRNGQIPAVLYGRNLSENVHVSCDIADFVRTYRVAQQNRVISLHVDDKEPVEALIYGYEIDPVSKRPSHVDFFVVTGDEMVTARIPIRLEGTPAGTRIGGILEFFVQDLRVRCLRSALMAEYVIDIANLKVDESVYIRDLEIPEGMEILQKPSQSIVRVTPSRVTKMADASGGTSDGADGAS